MAEELGDMSSSYTVSEASETQPIGTALIADNQASAAPQNIDNGNKLTHDGDAR